MTEKCFDIGTIQAFLDGELGSEMSERVACHTAACDVCAIMLAEAEEESAFAFSALENEFNTFVPTNRLWTKINDSIEGSKKTFWQTVFARFSNPSVAAFASLVIVVGLFVAMLSVKPDNEFVAKNNPNEQVTTASTVGTESSIQQVPQTESKADYTEITKLSSPIEGNDKPRFVKAAFPEKESNQQPIKNRKPDEKNNRNPNSSTQPEASVNGENLLGEDVYVETIATLEKTVESRKDEVLKPAARFAFERDLAVTEDAIKKMKAVVKKNPKNEAAKDVLRASYENKIDLLNSVAEKTELMASLK
jgi:hypothetical protein